MVSFVWFWPPHRPLSIPILSPPNPCWFLRGFNYKSRLAFATPHKLVQTLFGQSYDHFQHELVRMYGAMTLAQVRSFVCMCVCVCAFLLLRGWFEKEACMYVCTYVCVFCVCFCLFVTGTLPAPPPPHAPTHESNHAGSITSLCTPVPKNLSMARDREWECVAAHQRKSTILAKPQTEQSWLHFAPSTFWVWSRVNVSGSATETDWPSA